MFKSLINKKKDMETVISQTKIIEGMAFSVLTPEIFDYNKAFEYIGMMLGNCGIYTKDVYSLIRYVKTPLRCKDPVSSKLKFEARPCIDSPLNLYSSIPEKVILNFKNQKIKSSNRVGVSVGELPSSKLINFYSYGIPEKNPIHDLKLHSTMTAYCSNIKPEISVDVIRSLTRGLAFAKNTYVLIGWHKFYPKKFPVVEKRWGEEIEGFKPQKSLVTKYDLVGENGLPNLATKISIDKSISFDRGKKQEFVIPDVYINVLMKFNYFQVPDVLEKELERLEKIDDIDINTELDKLLEE
jgi:hypothetical protein